MSQYVSSFQLQKNNLRYMNKNNYDNHIIPQLYD